MNYPTLNFPSIQLRARRGVGGRTEVYDKVRAKWLVLTPEEWVRQHFVAFLVSHRGYPAGRIGNEISLSLNGMPRRCDTVVYDAQGNPLALVEYKAPHVTITQDTFDQIVRYNTQFLVPYIIVSNGLTHYCCHIDYTSRTHTFLPEIPTYDDMMR
jgi:hypothetical protein